VSYVESRCGIVSKTNDVDPSFLKYPSMVSPTTVKLSAHSNLEERLGSRLRDSDALGNGRFSVSGPDSSPDFITCQ